MKEPGINTFDEFLLVYAAATVVIGALWVILEADVLLGRTNDAARRRRRQRPVLHALTVLGVLHPACAAVAFDASRVDDDTPAMDVTKTQRMRRRAKTTAFVGVALFALLCAPHLPILDDLPAVATLSGAIPWETS